MGASGAGKSTLLDILARKRKRGSVSGTTLVNGRAVPDAMFGEVMGFVDQEDTLMPTLTVYETVLYSALLRLPREMSLEAKKFRTLETMGELGILGIKDARIGESGRRSISGGEKRRVSIACELVTSPSILFLDEPTSGAFLPLAFCFLSSSFFKLMDRSGRVQRAQRHRESDVPRAGLQPHGRIHDPPAPQQHRRAVRPARAPRAGEAGVQRGDGAVSGVFRADWEAVSGWV